MCNFTFIVNKTIPTGYAIVAKYEWFVNGVSVKTSTDPSDNGLNWVVVSKPTNVYCKVTYKKSDGITFSDPYTSTTFTPTIKELNFSNITTSTASPNYGCTTSTVSYSLNRYTCTSFCAMTYNSVEEYNITWQPPTGWIQTNISTNGNNVSFTPDASSGGLLTAFIQLSCGYTETKAFEISRAVQAPIFTASNVISCTSSATMSINSICGASNYTYTIVGNPGITFTSNGQQTLTSTNTTINISIAGGGSINSINAKANYINNVTSAEANSTLTVGTGTNSINYTQKDVVWENRNAFFYGAVQSIPSAINYEWYSRDESVSGNPFVLRQSMNANTADFPLGAADRYYTIRVVATNPCGSIVSINEDGYIWASSCYGELTQSIKASPNPTKGNIILELINKQPLKSTLNSTDILEVQISNKFAVILIKKVFGKGTKQVNINLSNLNPDIYIVKVWNGIDWISSQIVKE